MKAKESGKEREKVLRFAWFNFISTQKTWTSTSFALPEVTGSFFHA
jgi:hypothetical protein